MRVVYSEAHEAHAPETFLSRGVLSPCPETPERAARLLAALTEAGYAVQAPREFGAEPLATVHSLDYLGFLEQGFAEWAELPGSGPEIVPNMHPGRHMSTRPSGIVGLAGYHVADTASPIGAGTWAAARASANCALTAAELVLEGADHAYALCRPPGHHADHDMAGGFCFLNNVAIAAALMARRLGRVAVLDVDVHHGNGTQGIFYHRNDVFFCSLHGDPASFYPFFAGHAHERGTGPGHGFNLNLPLAHGSGDDVFMGALDIGCRAIERFAPAALLISLGLDAQANDPLGVLDISTDGFARMAAEIAKLGRPTVLVQEGGYLCPELGANLVSFLDAFAAAHRVACA